MKFFIFSELFKEMDVSEDGKFLEVEVKGLLKEVFVDVDFNEDGFIIKEEFDKVFKFKGKRCGN